MTDRGKDALCKDTDTFTVGPSSMRWQRDRLIVDINEWSAPPHLTRLSGRIEIVPSALTSVEVPLTPDGAHVWRPFAPSCRISVDIGRRGWQWQGHGYFDANFGTRALEADFSQWTWGRFPVRGGTTCFYDAQRRDGSSLALGLRFDADGTARPAGLPPLADLPRSRWALRRSTRCEKGHVPKQVLRMLDTPFYCRSAVTTCIGDEVTTGVHEALDLDRFRAPFLKPMIALRVPRRARWRVP